ncbi:ABC transporter permease [Microlunatus sp. GCM10028923]|uniref:ABC transporter permease n=1 Tax=Microlunatus sp. GCM10028923 TaxID=3273400 RepID=UPI00360979C5
MNATTAEPASAPVTEDALRSVLLAGERPPRPGPVLTSLTFGWRALLKIKHDPNQLVDVTMFPIMFTLMFTYLFGGALAGSTQEYLQFLLPGILVQANVIITMNTGITLNTGVFDRFRSLPVWRPSPLVGALLGDLVRYSIGSVIVITLGLILGFRPEGGAVGVVLSVVLLLVFSFCLSWLWTMLSLILRTPSSVAGVSMMVMLPLTFVSNIFVDPKTMPGWLQAVVEVNPITHLATAVRGLMNGSVPAGEVGWVLVSSVLLVAVFGPITMVLYRNKK